MVKQLTNPTNAGALIKRITSDALQYVDFVRIVVANNSENQHLQVKQSTGRHLLLKGVLDNFTSILNILFVFGIFSFNKRNELLYVEYQEENSAKLARQLLPLIFDALEVRGMKVTFFRRREQLSQYRVVLNNIELI